MLCTLFIWYKCIGDSGREYMSNINVHVREVKSCSEVGKK